MLMAQLPVIVALPIFEWRERQARPPSLKAALMAMLQEVILYRRSATVVNRAVIKEMLPDKCDMAISEDFSTLITKHRRTCYL